MLARRDATHENGGDFDGQAGWQSGSDHRRREWNRLRTALYLAKEGAALVAADLNSQGGEAVSGEITSTGGRAVFQHTDVSSEPSTTPPIHDEPLMLGIEVAQSFVARYIPSGTDRPLRVERPSFPSRR